MVPKHTVAGVMPYYALPDTSLWAGEILRLRLLGCHVVLVPIPWAYHSPAKGYHDFSEIRDLPLLFDLIAKQGMWTLPHIGPWMVSTMCGAGLPGWLWREGIVNSSQHGYHDGFLRALSEWWRHLYGALKQFEFIGTALSPGVMGSPVTTQNLTQILNLAQNVGCAAPISIWLEREGVAALHWLNREASAPARITWPVLTVQESHHVKNQFPQYSKDGTMLASLLHSSSGHDNGVVLEGITTEIQWGWWYNPTASQKLPITHEDFLTHRQHCMQAEIAQSSLIDSHLVENSGTIHPGCEIREWRSDSGVVVHIHNPLERNQYPQVVLQDPNTGAELITDELHVGAQSSHLLLAQLPLRGGLLIYSTVDIVLRTEVAGRELLVLRNDQGGEVRLSDDFRERHRKGAIFTERITQDGYLQLSVRFDPGKLASLLLDAPDGPVQILALDPHLSLRVWHLDDTWRHIKFPPSLWGLKVDEPARGIVIGPDYVVPDEIGSFRYLVNERGYGYRWGPWKGSNPNTWLAPLIWRTPASIHLPELAWETAAGAPEIAPDYDDQFWRHIAPADVKTMEALEIDVGFMWYRGRFKGTAQYIELACAHCADVFLNGKHIATLNSAPDLAMPTTKRFMLSSRLLQEENVLVVLTEAMGRTVNTGITHHGLLQCTLDQGQPILWTYRAGLTGEQQRQGVIGYADRALIPADADINPIITWHHASFTLDMPDSITGYLLLELVDVPVKAYVYLNGMLIYRTGLQSQRTQYVPLSLKMLDRDHDNSLLIAQWSRGATPEIGATRLMVGELFDWQRA